MSKQMTYKELKQYIISNYLLCRQIYSDPDNRIDPAEGGNWEGRCSELWAIIISAGWVNEIDRDFWMKFY